MVCLVWNRAEPAILGQLAPIGANRDQVNFISGQIDFLGISDIC